MTQQIPNRPTSATATGKVRQAKVAADLKAYEAHFDTSAGNDIQTRKQEYARIVNHFYDLVTDFYQFGWGDSFHFAQRRKGENFKASIRRHEHFIADELKLTSGLLALDVGCGVGGPLCEIARYSGAGVTGVNNNAYQVAKAERKLSKEDLADRCSIVKADFMQIPIGNNIFDAAYAIEATPHAPDKAGVFHEIYRTLKPGGLFAGFEWCLTDRFDPDDEIHRKLEMGIEVGNGLPDIATTEEVTTALTRAGFEVLETKDMALDCDPETPWYRSLQGRDLTLGSLPRTPLGRVLTNEITRPLETLGILPQGTSAVSALLNRAADDFIVAGTLGVFTPMFYFKARRPTSL